MAHLLVPSTPFPGPLQIWEWLLQFGGARAPWGSCCGLSHTRTSAWRGEGLESWPSSDPAGRASVTVDISRKNFTRVREAGHAEGVWLGGPFSRVALGMTPDTWVAPPLGVARVKWGRERHGKNIQGPRKVRKSSLLVVLIQGQWNGPVSF